MKIEPSEKVYIAFHAVGKDLPTIGDKKAKDKVPDIMTAACFTDHDLKDNVSGRANIQIYFIVMKRAFQKLFYDLEDKDGIIHLSATEKNL